LTYLDAARSHLGAWEPAEAIQFPGAWKERLLGPWASQ
jgi:hypothetical protein